MASCSNKAGDLDGSITTAEPNLEVGFTASISTGTRVADEEFQSGDDIAVQAFEGDAIFGSQADYTFDGTEFTSGNAIVRTSAEQELSYIAAYPSTVANFGKTFEFAVAADQTDDAVQSDLLVAIEAASTDTNPELTFYHAMTSLVIDFDFTGDGAADAETSGTLKIYGQTTATIDLSGETYSSVAAGYSSEWLTPAGNTTVIFAPQTISAGSVVAVYTVGDKTYTWTSNNNLNFNAGIRYTYTWAIDTDNADPEYEGEVSYTGEINGWGENDLTDDWMVTIDLDGGEISGSTDNIVGTVEDDELVADPGTPEKAGYTFDGWVYGAADDTFDFATTTITAHTTITATWAEIAEFTVSFDLAGGSYSGDASDIADKTVNRGETVAAITGGEVTKAYSTLTGWVYGDDDTEFVFGETEVYDDMTITAVWVSDGTYDYVISNETELIAFRTVVNGGDTDATAVLIDDITITESNWTPIGDSSNAFIGTFDGGDNTIYNLKISSTTNYQGFFGAVAGATIRNCTLSGASLTTSYTSTVNGTGASIGGFVGGAISSNSSTVTLTNLTVKNSAIKGGDSVGGIMGSANLYNQSYGVKIDISDCTIESDVTIEKTGNKYYLGGIIGYCSLGGTITNCHNKGAVTASNTNASNATTNAGIIGNAIGVTIVGCSNSGTISSKGNAFGGIVGSVGKNTSIIGCYNTGALVGTHASYGQNGAGIGGQVNATGIKIHSCYSTTMPTSSNTSATLGVLLGNFTSTTAEDSDFELQNCYYIGGTVAIGKDASIVSNTDDDGNVTYEPSLFADVAGIIDYATDIAGLNAVVGTMNANTTFDGYDYEYEAGSDDTTPPSIVVLLSPTVSTVE